MNLTTIKIKNFRSIKDEEVVFSHNCLVLLGKNEAGKSNVLKAIASVFGKYKVTDKDRRKKIDNERIDENYVRAVIKLSEDDFYKIEEKFNTKFSGVENIVFKSDIKLKAYIKKVFHSLLLQIDIANGEEPVFSYYRYDKNDIDLEQQVYLSGDLILLDGDKELNLKSEIFAIVKSLYLENPINCHYWEYDDKFLLPNSVDINSFKNSPSDHKALENVFQLCGRDNIQEEFQNALSGDGDYSNLLEQVSKKVTSTFQKIWKDFKGTSIELLPNGSEILIKVVGRAKYNCEDRSDGFKRFISILLMLSTRSRANKILENDLIIIDEPDQSLYPTSAQYLKDELIEIGRKSKVVYSTHSQYMIDSENLDRHIVVEKVDDITTLKKEDQYAPYTTDELLRRAIGSSIFECIKPKNIIFEGYLDKKLFNKYCKFSKSENKFKDYGQIYLAGISGVDCLVSILSSANKKFLIVADSDEASKNKRADFQKHHPEYKANWLAYADVCSSVSTMEDFMKEDYIKSQITLNGHVDYVYQSSKSAIFNIDKAASGDKDKKQELKNTLAQELKKENIEAGYAAFADKIKEELEGL